MGTRWRTLLLACAVAATLAAAVGLSASPSARAQPSPAGDTGSSSCSASNPPNELLLVGGTPQTAQLETGFAAALSVELANSNGCPITTAVSATPITFTAPPSGPSAVFAASGSSTLIVGSDATGSASVQMLTADDTAGTYTVTASSAYGSVSFSLTNTAAGIPASITPVAPSGRHASVNSHYAQPLAVRVLDADGNPVLGASVTFSLGTSGGSGAGASSAAGAGFDDGTSQATETTDADGVATSPGFSANATSGAFTATATVAHVTEPARFALENVAAKPYTIAPLGTSHPSATVATRYAHRLRVTVRDGSGAPVAGVTVTFTLGSPAAAGASAATGAAGATFADGSTQATEKTGLHGIATSPRLDANDDSGRFTATATTTASGASATFHLHNGAGAPSTLTAGLGAAQSTDVGSRFAVALAVTVSDAQGNKVPDAAVTFAAPSAGVGGSFAGGRTTVTVKTNSSGIAVAPTFSANDSTGGYIVTATVKGVHPVAFALVNTAP